MEKRIMMEFKKIPLSLLDANAGQIQGLPANPRAWTDREARRLAKSMKATPELAEARGCIVVPHEGRYVVLGGNLRLEGAKSLKWRDIMCAVLPEDTKPAKLQEIVLKDNSSFGSWDLSLLRRDWAEFDLPEWGIEVTWDTAGPVPDAAVSEREVVEDDFDETTSDIAKRCKRGDIWQLGDHRLMCGDALSLDTYQALLGDEKADLVFTDPPYGMGKTSAGIANDNQNASELLHFNEKWIKHSFDVLTANGSWYCWGTPEPLMDIYAFILRPMQNRGEVTFRNMITWWKGEGGLGVGNANLRCFPAHSEKCLFVMKGNEGFAALQDYRIPFCDELNRKFKEYGLTPEEAADKVCSLNKALSENNYEGRVKARKRHLIAYSMFTKPKPEYWQLWFGSMDGYEDFVARYEAARSSYREGFNYFDGVTDPSNDVWHIPTISAAEKLEGGRHASVKPQKLCAKAITASSRAGHIVLDCFGGSGSTLITCESLGRRARLIELIPEWCDVIIARWEKYTGRKATKIN